MKINYRILYSDRQGSDTIDSPSYSLVEYSNRRNQRKKTTLGEVGNDGWILSAIDDGRWVFYKPIFDHEQL